MPPDGRSGKDALETQYRAERPEEAPNHMDTWECSRAADSKCKDPEAGIYRLCLDEVRETDMRSKRKPG